MMNNDELFIAITDAFDKKVEEVKLHTGVLVEDLRKDVRAIAEGHDILFNKMDKLEKKVDGLEKKVGGLESKVGGLESKVGGLESKVGGLESKVGGLEMNMNIVKDYVIGVDAKLNEHEVILKRVR